MQCKMRVKIFCRWLSLTSLSRAGSVNLPRTSFPLTMKDNVAQKEVAIQEVTTNGNRTLRAQDTSVTRHCAEVSGQLFRH